MKKIINISSCQTYNRSKKAAVFSLLLVVAMLFTGCGARVEVTNGTETSSSSLSTQKESTSSSVLDTTSKTGKTAQIKGICRVQKWLNMAK